MTKERTLVEELRSWIELHKTDGLDALLGQAADCLERQGAEIERLVRHSREGWNYAREVEDEYEKRTGASFWCRSLTGGAEVTKKDMRRHTCGDCGAVLIGLESYNKHRALIHDDGPLVPSIDCPLCGQGHTGPAAVELREKLLGTAHELEEQK